MGRDNPWNPLNLTPQNNQNNDDSMVFGLIYTTSGVDYHVPATFPLQALH